MSFIIFFFISLFFFASSLIWAGVRAKKKYKIGQMLTPVKIISAGIVLSSLSLFIPIVASLLKTTNCGFFETLFISVNNMIKLFVVDSDFSIVTDNVATLPRWVERAYTVLGSILFVFAPILTFGFVLSFFQNAYSYIKYFAHRSSNVYIFSSLNERSLALAKSLSLGSGKRLLVFTDSHTEGELNDELREQAKSLGAILFKKDIISNDFSFHSKSAELNFFAIGEDHSENVSHALRLIADPRYKDRQINLYVFSTQVESELLLSNAFSDGSASHVRLRRVNEVQSLIFRTLYDTGYESIFKSAIDDEDGSKLINAVVIGMGQHGSEMTKALSWFCQMKGYKTEINCFDLDPRAEGRFISSCPELMDPKYNSGRYTEEDAGYKITVHSGIDVTTKAFDDILLSLPKTTYVFVALGNDERNISASVKLRALFMRQAELQKRELLARPEITPRLEEPLIKSFIEMLGKSPVIQAVVYNSDKKEALSGVKNYRDQDYKIEFVGDLDSSYSEDVVLHLDLEKTALQRHLKWGNETEFWQYDYNYKSSIASAIHYKMKIKCAVSGIEKAPADRSEEELWSIRRLEHRRWNAYMRSEGYVYSGSPEKASRNDLAKMHHCLIPFSELSTADKQKDDD